MSCTCNKSHHSHTRNSHPNRCGCNSCNDLGCKDIVYPKCILTDTAYPCIGIGAGKTGSVLFAAIDSALCTLKNKNVIVAGCTQTLDSGDYITITSTPTTVSGVTTYTVCLGTDVIDFFNAIQSSLTTNQNEIDDINTVLEAATACLYDGTGGCEIDNIEIQITSINDDITTINNSITTINNTLSDATGCLFDGSGGCQIDNILDTLDTLEDETFKTLGAGGNMENGQPVPAVTVAVTLQAVGRLRRHTANHTEINFLGNVEVNGFGIGTLFTLPTGYRPLVTLQYAVAGTSSTSTDTYVGFVRVATNGVVTLNVVTSSIDTNFQLNWNVLVPTD